MSVLHHGDGRPVNRAQYEWKSASVTVVGIGADTNLKTIVGFTTLFDTVKLAHEITIEASGTAYVRLDSATNDKITLGATTPYTDNFAEVSSLWVSTNNAAITITVKLR